MEKLLIADDESSIRLLVGATLASQQYQILEASTGTQALDIIRAEKPRMVLLDVRMPGLDGLEVCRQIKADPDLGDISIVMLTGNGHPEQIAEGMDAGADHYLTKPFSPLQLLQLVDNVMH